MKPLFKFLTYLQPTRYFSLATTNGYSVFPVFEALPEAVKQQLHADDAYESATARMYDLSWQALHKGYIGAAETINNVEDLLLVDNYIFSRKYFSPFWVFYVLCFRLLIICLKN